MNIVVDSPNRARLQFGSDLAGGGPSWFMCQSTIDIDKINDPSTYAPTWETFAW